MTERASHLGQGEQPNEKETIAANAPRVTSRFRPGGSNIWSRPAPGCGHGGCGARRLIVAVLTAVVLFTTGLVGSSVALVKDCVDTTRIALMPGPGWPQQTGVMEPTQVLPMTGGFVELGGDSCVVYSRTGTRLNSIQSGYGRPALAAGKTRFVLYNRSGNELRVESRTQNLYTKKLENKIFLCAMSDNGTLAVVTDDVSSMAELLVYSPTMEQQLRWNMTSNDGTPLRMAFSPDSRRLAAAAVTAGGGQMQTNLYVVTLAQGDPVNVGSQSGVPQWVGWLSRYHPAGRVRQPGHPVQRGRRRACPL